MPKNHLTYSVFVGAPADAAADVEAIRRVATEVNRLQSACRFEVRYWAADAVTSIGRGDAQFEIDAQLHDGSDVYLFLFHARIGTLLESGLTGTEHEFQKAAEAVESGSATHVGLFFNTGDVSIKVDVDQLARLQKFRARIESENSGLYQEYASQDELEIYTRQILMRIADSPNSPISTPDYNDDIEENVKHNIIEEMENDEELERPGILDLQEVLEENLAQATEFLRAFPERQSELTEALEKFQEKTRYVDPNALSAKEKKAILQEPTDAMESFVSDVEPGAQKYFEQIKKGFNAGLLAIQFSLQEGEDVTEFLEAVIATRKQMQKYNDINTNLINSINKIPPLTSRMKKAKRRLLDLHGLVLEATTTGIRLALKTEDAAKVESGD